MPAFDQPLIDAVQQLIDAACHYRLADLAQCYAPDLRIMLIQEDGAVATFNYEQCMAFFRQRRESGAEPINTAVEFNYAQQHSGIGHVVATRYIDWGGGEKKIVFTILLRQEPQPERVQWRVFCEQAVVVGDA